MTIKSVKIHVLNKTILLICCLFFIMTSQFYLTLPSNSSTEYFPANTLTNFKTKLTQPVELAGDWEVALVVSDAFQEVLVRTGTTQPSENLSPL